ncbi:hypothetical protein CEXT_342441 [Caerostris extrusa]|uniref:Uncharacterized protein n=1 Tax=Caerostris extrusa TaxID=172846 RepID=A0AAV4WBX1_CAEEX|nr:hypothetical protein CEXT_342441 [Caerostris extrusa]
MPNELTVVMQKFRVIAGATRSLLGATSRYLELPLQQYCSKRGVNNTCSCCHCQLDTSKEVIRWISYLNPDHQFPYEPPSNAHHRKYFLLLQASHYRLPTQGIEGST